MHNSKRNSEIDNNQENTIINRIIDIINPNRILSNTKDLLKKVIILLYRVKGKSRLLTTVLKKCRLVLNALFPKLGSRISRIIAVSRMNEVVSYIDNGSSLNNDDCWIGEEAISNQSQPLVSIIVPNFNHSIYLRERLESIYNQTYTNFEVILLDDCSTDNSRTILTEYAERYPEKTIVDFNISNSGKVFKQWNKGISHANGELIWIAESDDWCDLDFLEKMVPQFEYQSVMLAFCRSVFMQNGQQIWTLEEYLSDIPYFNFKKSFQVSAHIVVNKAFGIKNIIPNVSSALFRNIGHIPNDVIDIWQNMQLCGDWLFYLNMIKGGTLSYNSEVTNYYRVHNNSTSLRIQKTVKYYKEQEQISKYIVQNYDVDLNIFKKVQYILEQHYMSINKTENIEVVHENYNIDRISSVAKNRNPSVLMCGFSLQIGGGETYPIFLANELKKQGITVTFLNFNLDTYSNQVRHMIDKTIPVVTLKSPDYLGKILYQTGADIVHSHHASVDAMVSVWLGSMDIKCKQVITMHGMYETMDKENCLASFNLLRNTCKKIIYIADKNLNMLNLIGYTHYFNLIKIGNGLPKMSVSPISRKELGIESDAFVFCIVSRALPQKGWMEATTATIMANKTSKRKIHLILVGDGEMYGKLSSLNSPYIHLVGQQSNVRDYFATADMGLLPSTYKGESFPLVVIECLLTGKPVMASNIGEIKYLLSDVAGEIAGILVELSNWKIDIQELSSMMAKIANDNSLYKRLQKRVPSASEKFDMVQIVKKHLDVYTEVQQC